MGPGDGLQAQACEERGEVGRLGRTRARALCRPALSLSRMSLCSRAESSASWADTSSILSPETVPSSCSRRP